MVSSRLPEKQMVKIWHKISKTKQKIRPEVNGQPLSKGDGLGAKII